MIAIFIEAHYARGNTWGAFALEAKSISHITERKHFSLAFCEIAEG
jgi:hypothetical protein